MSSLARIGVIIAATGLLTTLVLPGRMTPQVVGAAFNGVSQWTKQAQGRG